MKMMMMMMLMMLTLDIDDRSNDEANVDDREGHADEDKLSNVKQSMVRIPCKGCQGKLAEAEPNTLCSENSGSIVCVCAATSTWRCLYL